MGVYADWAPKYFEAGYIPLPVNPDTKVCSIPKWEQIFTKDLTEKKLDMYIQLYGDWDIAIVMGEASGITGADFDWKDDHVELFDELVKSVLPITPLGKKSSEESWTLFYKLKPGFKKTYVDREFQKQKKRFMDFLSDGPSYCVVYPSQNSKSPTGKVRWISDFNFLNYDKAELPELTEEHVAAIKDIADYTNEEIHRDPEQNSGREPTLRGQFIFLFKKKLSEEQIVELIVDYDAQVNGKTAKGAYLKDKSFHGKSPKQAALQLVKKWTKSYTAFLEKRQGKPYEPEGHPTKNQGFFYVEEIEKKNGEIVEKRWPDYHGLARYMGKECGLAHSGSFTYIYDTNHYRMTKEAETKFQINELTLRKALPAQINAFHQTVLNTNFKSDEFFKQPEGKINLRNGVLDIKTRRMELQTQDVFFKYVLPVSYDPVATCPNWLDFLSFVYTDKDGKERPELEALTAEMFGYILAGGAPFLHKAFFLYGEGRNGKSTVLDVLRYLVGNANYSSVPIQNFDKPFSVVMMDGKLANIIGETTAKQIDSESFKIAVGGEQLTAAQKGMPEYQLSVTARLVMACNRFPKFHDATTGSYEKLCILPFEQYISAEKRDPFFARDKLFPEAAGILNWALKGYERLIARGRLPEVQATAKVLEEYRTESDSVKSWIEEHVLLGELAARYRQLNPVSDTTQLRKAGKVFS